MRLSESAQEALELLWVAIAEDDKPGLPVDEVTTEEIDELKRQRLVEQPNGLLTLTASGREEAALAVRRHRLAERLLADVLATEEAKLDEQACRLEHALFEGVDDNICTLLGHPRFCPHGKPIPAGDCCRRKLDVVHRLVAPLSELEPGQHGQIAYIQMSNPNRLQKLMAMGVLPGVPVTLVRRFPSFVFEAGYSQFAVDEEIASDIYVRLGKGQ